MKKFLIIYDTSTGNTGKMAKYIAEGAQSVLANVMVKSINEFEVNDLEGVTGIAIGCPTYYRALTDGMKNFLEKAALEMKKEFAGKIGVAFGAYGWSGESIKLLNETMRYFKMKVLEIDQGTTGTPDETLYLTALSEIMEKSVNFGKEIAKQITKTKSKRRLHFRKKITERIKKARKKVTKRRA